MISELEYMSWCCPPTLYTKWHLKWNGNAPSLAIVACFLLALSQAALRDAPVGSSTAHLAYLERERYNAEERLAESEFELERVVLDVQR